MSERQAMAFKNNSLRYVELSFVTLLLLFAVGLRFAGIAYGQPQMQYHPTDAARHTLPLETPIHPDEYFYVAIPLQMVVRRDFEPHFYENPSFLINLDFLTYWITGASGGKLPDDLAEVGQRQYAPFPLYVIGRVYSALGGLLAVAGAYAAARLLGGRFAAAGAGLLTAVSFPMVQHAHYATTSSLAAGFAALAIWASFASLKTGRGALFLLAGALSGFAISNRYNAAAILVLLFGAGVLLALRYRHLWRSVCLGWILAPVAFLIGTPGAVTDLRQFWSDFSYIFLAYTAGGQVSYSTPYGLFFEYRYLVLFGLGVPAALAALLGFANAVRQRFSLRVYSPSVCVILLGAYIAAYSVVVLRTVRPSHSDQLLLLVIPAFAILAGLGAQWLYDSLPVSKIVLAPTLAMILATIPLILSLQLVRQLSLPDTRLVMQTWIHENLPEGTRIHLAGPYNVPLDPILYPSSQDYAGQYTPISQLYEDGVDYVMFSDAYLHDLQRSHEIVPPELLEQTRSAYSEYATLPVAARIDRPRWTGYDWMMHTASVWHNPGLTLYCLECTDSPS